MTTVHPEVGTDANTPNPHPPPPYVTSKTALNRIIDFFRRTGRFPQNAQECIKLELTTDLKVANQCLNVLRRFGMLNADGTPTDRGRSFRIPEEQPGACAEILQENYPALAQILKENPGQFPREQLKRHLIKEDHMNSESAISKILQMVEELNSGFPMTGAPPKSKSRKQKVTGGDLPPAVDLEEKNSIPEESIPDLPLDPLPEIKKQPSGDPAQPVQEKVKKDQPMSVLSPDIGTRVLPLAPLKLNILVNPNADLGAINLVFDRVERLLERFGSAILSED